MSRQSGEFNKKTLTGQRFIVQCRVAEYTDENGELSYRIDIPSGAVTKSGIIYALNPYDMDGRKGISLKERQPLKWE